MMVERKTVLSYLPAALLVVTLAFLMIGRVHLGLTRFFDVDEFTYLHWAANAAKGLVPYRDYFLWISPGFVWVFAMLFAVMGATAQVFIAARVVALGFFVLMLGLLSVLFGITRSWKWAILPAVILAFLPMPYDKFLELRPDNLGTLFALAGLVVQVVALKKLVQKAQLAWCLSGILYALSLMTILKTMPFVAIGIFIAALPVLLVLPTSLRSPIGQDLKNFLSMMFGFSVPVIFVLLWSWGSGNFLPMIYQVTKVPFEVYLNGTFAPMEPNLFFYPNSSFYGGSGFAITQGLLVNHALWLVGIGVGLYRLVTPFLTGKKREDVLVELLISGIFFVSVLGYVKFFPLRHTQYLIPIALFIAYYAADGLSMVFDWLARVGGGESLGIVLFGFGFLLYQTGLTVAAPKVYTNTLQLQQLTVLQGLIHPGTRVFDMEGRMVFWPDAYTVCCLPMGFEKNMRYPPPPIIPSLSTTDYIFQGESNRLSTLSPDEYAYVLAHFAPVEKWGDALWVRKK